MALHNHKTGKTHENMKSAVAGRSSQSHHRESRYGNSCFRLFFLTLVSQKCCIFLLFAMFFAFFLFFLFLAGRNQLQRRRLGVVLACGRGGESVMNGLQLLISCFVCFSRVGVVQSHILFLFLLCFSPFSCVSCFWKAGSRCNAAVSASCWLAAEVVSL